jgi:hypothetical protein
VVADRQLPSNLAKNKAGGQNLHFGSHIFELKSRKEEEIEKQLIEGYDVDDWVKQAEIADDELDGTLDNRQKTDDLDPFSAGPDPDSLMKQRTTQKKEAAPP